MGQEVRDGERYGDIGVSKVLATLPYGQGRLSASHKTEQRYRDTGQNSRGIEQNRNTE
jgi:hypothetical protein